MHVRQLYSLGGEEGPYFSMMLAQETLQVVAGWRETLWDFLSRVPKCLGTCQHILKIQTSGESSYKEGWARGKRVFQRIAGMGGGGGEEAVFHQQEGKKPRVEAAARQETTHSVVLLPF